MNDKLKPCPFCGKEVDFDNAYEDDGGYFIPANIYCPCCGIIMKGRGKKLKYDDKGHINGGWLTEEELNEYDNELAEKWNNRRYVSKPHGRLIDADKVLEDIRKRLGIRSLDYLLQAEKPIVMSIQEAPTVVETEGDEDE